MIDRAALRAQTVASGRTWLDIELGAQRLHLRRGEAIERSYAVRTAINGPGELSGSGCTPRGWHQIRARIGAGAPSGAVFVGRRATGEIYSPELGARFPERDWILTRILWLSGLEPGFNRLGERDSMRRFIYIHGSPDEKTFGVPGSKGCVNLRNHELIELFELVAAGTRVLLRD